MDLPFDPQLLVTALETLAPVAGLWVFGSVARGEARAASDLDLAVLFTAPVPILHQLAIKADLETVAGRSVDLVDLRRAGPIIGMRVLREGELVHEGDRRQVTDFIAGTPLRYADLKRIRREAERLLISDVRRG